MTKKLLHNNYIDVDYYYQGILLGIMYDDQTIHLVIPFIMLDIKLYMFIPRSWRNKKRNKRTF